MRDKKKLRQFHLWLSGETIDNLKILAIKQGKRGASQLIREYIEDLWKGIK